MYKVVEIFDSIEGEGKRAGRPATFIRFAGCNLRCRWCDTLYALFGEKEECKYTEMSLDDILKRDIKTAVTITGGEPLIADGISELCDELLRGGHEVNIETNGAADIMDFMQRILIHDEDKLFFTIDYKLPSSNEESKMLWSNFESLMPWDVVKFVVADDNDFERMLEIVKKLQNLYEETPIIYINAVFGEYDLEKLAERIVSEPILDTA
ncbi:MAG: radical SAM protein, partial [Clostridia bacterium]|nr:radical SAM protein [Clostridia bacterium]